MLDGLKVRDERKRQKSMEARVTFFSVVMYRCWRLKSNSRFLLTLSPVTSADARPYTSGWADRWTFSTYTNITTALTVAPRPPLESTMLHLPENTDITPKDKTFIAAVN